MHRIDRLTSGLVLLARRMLFRAAGKTLDDPQWVGMGNPTGDEVSFNSQPTYVVQYTPHTGDPYFVYM